MYSDLKKHLPPFEGAEQDWKFNTPEGQIGLHAVDSQQGPTIRFVIGDDIPSEIVSGSSRANTRILLEGLNKTDARSVVSTANRLLKAQRDITQDVFMTAFKGLRKDGKYRRRLDYSQARGLLNVAYAEVLASKTEKLSKKKYKSDERT